MYTKIDDEIFEALKAIVGERGGVVTDPDAMQP